MVAELFQDKRGESRAACGDRMAPEIREPITGPNLLQVLTRNIYSPETLTPIFRGDAALARQKSLIIWIR